MDGKLLQGTSRVSGDSGYNDLTGLLLKTGQGDQYYLRIVEEEEPDQISRMLRY